MSVLKIIFSGFPQFLWKNRQIRPVRIRSSLCKIERFSISHTSTAYFLMRSSTTLVCYIYAAALVGITVSCSASQRAVVPQTPKGRSDKSVNINIASADELSRIPGLGPKLAGEIVKFRDEHGRFRRPEHLLLIHGMSDRRYREISPFVKTE